ncbi:hypothetical protein [Corynebacterium nasicanis]|uniref:Uncharacterized protein n=1 Tax=Corynebacterium nasicanis TaxID=1448267 RepID=A0ABW1QDU1_9CORY
MSTTSKFIGKANPHEKGTREWVEWEDAYFREMKETGAIVDLAKAIIAIAEHVTEEEDHVLVDESFLAYADVEDGRVFAIHSTQVHDNEDVFIPVWDTVLDRGLDLVEDREEENNCFFDGRARVRVFA